MFCVYRHEGLMVFTEHLRAKHRFHAHEELTDTLTVLNTVALSSIFICGSQKGERNFCNGPLPTIHTPTLPPRTSSCVRVRCTHWFHSCPQLLVQDLAPGGKCAVSIVEKCHAAMLNLPASRFPQVFLVQPAAGGRALLLDQPAIAG